MSQINDLYELVASLQNEARYKHTLGVVSMAETFATTYNIDLAKCKLAALLHDVTKQMDKPKQLELLKECNDEFILNNPPLWHSFTGEIYAREVLKITDTDILDSIKYHTLGHPHPSEYMMVIYLSDYLEMGREYEQLGAFRDKIGVTSLSELYKQVAKYRIEYELSRGRSLHHVTEELYESVK